MEIIIIDDERGILYYMKDALTRLLADDAKIFTFHKPLIAIEHMLENKPVLVITDMIMPGMNGDEVLRCVKEKYPDVPVIIMTGFSDCDFSKLNHSGVLAKPFRISGLKELLGRLNISLK
jgi:DNA-binding NtrC family response regulator